MRALVQRVLGASVSIDGNITARIEGPGLCVFVGVTHADTKSTAVRCADKAYDLRIFQSTGLAEVSASDLRLPLLVVSQFTLYGQTCKGRRPTWELAAPRDVAEPLVEVFVDQLRTRGAKVATGEFGANMAVTLTNDGPMTLMVEVS